MSHFRTFRRPRVRTVLLLVNLVILLLPLGGIGVLRIYENELVRRAEAELIAQGAFVAAAYKSELLHLLEEHPEEDSDNYGNQLELLECPAVGAFARSDMNCLERGLHPVQPRLDLALDDILPRPPDAEIPDLVVNELAVQAGQLITPVMEEAQQTTLAGIRVVDPNGVVVATTGSELGLSLLNREEVERALTGEAVSVLRERISDEPDPPLGSMRRRADMRVFVAIPITRNSRVLGAVILSRTPVSLGEAVYRNRAALGIGATALLFVILLVSALTSFTISRPVSALIKQTERVTAGEKGAAEVLKEPGTLEIAQLSEAFSEMAKTLEERSDYIRTFASSVSHGFKTPLTSIQGAVELLEDHLDEMSPEELKKFLTIVSTDAERLERLVNRLHELARAEVLRPGDEKAPVEHVIDQISDRFRTAGTQVSVTHGKGVETVRMAPETLETILSTLFENACQHGGDDVTISVKTKSIETGSVPWVEFQVKDTGKGVSKGNADRIFSPFFTTAENTERTGLGLPIIASLIRAHQGTIELVRSKKGAAFLIRLLRHR